MLSWLSEATKIVVRSQDYCFLHESGISAVDHFYPTQVEIEDSMLLRDRWLLHNKTTSSKSTQK
jgi:hypothetical protein